MKNTIILIYVRMPGKEIHPAIYYLKEYAQKYAQTENLNILTEIVSSTANISDTTKKIFDKNPQFVGFSTYVWNADKTYEIIKNLKQKQPHLPIILGGAEASYRAEKILVKNKNIDIIAIDEAEETFTELVDNFCSGGHDFSNIKGIVYRKVNKIIKTKTREPLNLDKIPSPFLSTSIPITKKQTVTYETSRGCPFRCAYCSYNAGSYAKMRFFPITRVKKELVYILSKKPKRINIVDDNFNIYESRAKKITTTVRSSVGDTIMTMFLRADVWKLSESLVRLLSHKKIFCTIGIQSLNIKTLQSAQRIHNRDVLENNLTLLKEKKVNFILQFIIGLPGDQYKDVLNMIDWACFYTPYDIHLQTLRINPKTIYEEKATQFGITYKHTLPYTIYKINSMNRTELKKAEHLALYFKAVYKSKLLRKELFDIHIKTKTPISKIIEESYKKNKIIFSLPKFASLLDP